MAELPKVSLPPPSRAWAEAQFAKVWSGKCRPDQAFYEEVLPAIGMSRETFEEWAAQARGPAPKKGSGSVRAFPIPCGGAPHHRLRRR